MENKVFLGFGSNKGDRLKYFTQAIDLLTKDRKCIFKNFSSVYETTPYGLTEQENFYNAAAEIETDLEIEGMYTLIKSIELEIGREKNGLRWGPREIDVDILFYNNLIYNSDKLTVPHKEILKRDFVIIPLIQIAPDYVHPVLNQKLYDIDLSTIEKHIIGKIDFTTKHIN